MKKERQSNFELLRCVLMLMIILTHYNSSIMGNALSYAAPGSVNYGFLCFAESLSIIGTNGFVLLAGYFGWKKDRVSLRKPVGLLVYVIAYKVMTYVLGLVLLKEPFTARGFASCFLPNNWFVVLYIVLMLLSPYINAVIGNISRRSFLTLLTVAFLLFSVWPGVLDVAQNRFGIDTVGLNTIAVSGSGSGYSIVNFVLLYLIGAFISKYDALRYRKHWDVLGYLLCSVFSFAQETFLGAGWSYSNPFVILSAVFFTNIFRKTQLASRFVNGISKANFGVFLLHTQYLVWGWFWAGFDISRACRGSLAGCAWNMLLCCLMTYVLCAALDTVCRFAARPVSKWLDTLPVLNKTIVETRE